MADLSDFKRGQIIGARMAGASVAKSAELFGVVRITVSKVMTSFEKEGKPSNCSKTLEESGLLRGLRGITRIQLQKLQQILMTISRTL